ncbi:MAG: fatty acid CoA ligase family protein [Planctomycetota bacterium]
MTKPLNIADRLRTSARLVPHQPAIHVPHARDHRGRTAWTMISFADLDTEVDAAARGLLQLGVRPGHRLVLMVRPSIEFIALTFAVFRAGAVCVLIDPGMGRSSVLRCLEDVDPHGFLAIPPVHALRRLMPWRYRNARFNVIVRPGWLKFGCVTDTELADSGRHSTHQLPTTRASDPAAVIFTSGSTGAPKGVVFEHRMFDAQVDLIRDRYQIQPGETDVPGFPLFALFNLAMQVTTVIPDMDPTRPAAVNPRNILEAFYNHPATQAYGSPAMWNRVGRYCETHGLQLSGLRRVLSAGAPVPLHVLKRMTAALPEAADLFTPYGATECLPVASIGGREILRDTAALTARGRGTCVGSPFTGIDVRIIAVTDKPLASLADARLLPNGEIGEIIVRGPVATREYFRQPTATALAKIPDGDSFWHRMGDVGYLDHQQKLWFCGRKAHIVHAAAGPMYSVCCEAIFDQHPDVYRSALVGFGPQGAQKPIIVIEPEPSRFPESAAAADQFRHSLLQLGQASPLTADISTILFHRSFPVDTRHNVKIHRETLAAWAQKQLRSTF